MLSGLAHRFGEFRAVGRNILPEGGRNADRRGVAIHVAVEGKQKSTFHESRQSGCGEVSPNFILAQNDVLSLHESFLAGFVRGRFEPPPGGDALALAPRRGDDRAFEDDPSRVPSAYRPIAGWEAFERALHRLRNLAEIHGFRILVVAFTQEATDERKDRGLRIAAELGLPILDFGKAEAAYMRAHGIAAYPGSVLTVSGQDAHPSALSHGIAATELLAWMTSEGLVDVRDARRAP